jgi:hypothetical protein
VTFTRAHAFAVVLLTSILTMTTAPAFAGPAHEVCHEKEHGCAKLVSCCCSDQGDLNLSSVPSGRTVAGVDATHSVAVVSLSFTLPAVVVTLIHEGPPPLVRPQDLSVLFSDLRL